MKQWLKSLYSPFKDSIAHSVCVCLAALLVCALLIFCAHSIMNLSLSDMGSSSSDSSYVDAALKAEQEKVASEVAQ